MFSEQVLDIETIIEKTKEVNNRDLFEKILHENDAMSPFLKKKPPSVDAIKRNETGHNMMPNSHLTHSHSNDKFYRPMNVPPNPTPHSSNNYNIKLGTINRFDFRNSLNPIKTPLKLSGLSPNESPYNPNPKKSLERIEKPNEKPLETSFSTLKPIQIQETAVNIVNEQGKKGRNDSAKKELSLIQKEVEETNNNNGNGKSPGKSNKNPLIAGCKCKKSRCLKLYCECFSAKNLCKDTCNCIDCANQEGTGNQKDSEKTNQNHLVNNPSVFVSHDDDSSIRNGNNKKEDKEPKKGCNCKKSHCLKRYCECFEAKLKCDSLCKCEDCKNFEEDPKKLRKKLPEEPEKPLKKKKV